MVLEWLESRDLRKHNTMYAAYKTRGCNKVESLVRLEIVCNCPDVSKYIKYFPHYAYKVYSVIRLTLHWFRCESHIVSVYCITTYFDTVERTWVHVIIDVSADCSRIQLLLFTLETHVCRRSNWWSTNNKRWKTQRKNVEEKKKETVAKI